MTDLLAQGAAWLEDQRHQHLTRSVTYVSGAESVEIAATIGRTEFDQADEHGLIRRTESRDYLLRSVDLVIAGEQVLPKAGNRKRVIETNEGGSGDRTVDYGYDGLYRLTSETITEGTLVSRRVVYTYDKVGNRQTMTVTENDGQGCLTQTLVTYEYDHNDRLTRSVADTDPVSFGAQMKFDRYYGSRPRPWTRWFALSFVAVTLAAFWLPLLIPSRRRSIRTAPVRKRPLVRESFLALTRAGIRSRKQSRAREEADACEVRAPLGRRARRKRLFNTCIASFLVPLFVLDPESVHALTTEALHAHMALAAGVALDCDPTVVETFYTYDDNGNQTSRQVTEDQTTTSDTFIFDAENRLAGFRKAVNGVPDYSASVSYTYDADGIRTSKTIGGATTLYLTDKQQPFAQVLEERDGLAGDLIVRYTYGDDLISQQRLDTTGTRYYHYDGQMSTRQLSDAATPVSVTVSDRYTYDAFGATIDAAGPTENAYRYTGEQFDSVMQLYYLRTRYYSARSGRFSSRDTFWGTVFDPRTLHCYQYAHSSPVMFVDFDGRNASAAATATITVGQLAPLVLAAVFVTIAALLLLQVIRGTFDLLRYLLRDLSWNLIAVGMLGLLLSNKATVQRSINNALRKAANALKEALRQLRKLKPFFVVRSIMPTIYEFNTFALARRPDWYVLRYNGFRSPLTKANRAYVRGKYEYLRLTAPPSSQLDEFPFASTQQGGRGALGRMVPAWENATQGGYLGFHYLVALRGRRTRFLVVPVSL